MYWCAADIVRAMDVESLSGFGARVGLSGECYNSVDEAVLAARLATNGLEGEQAVVFGSVFVVGEVV